MRQEERRPAPRGGPLLSMRGIQKDFPGVRALDGVSLSVAHGRIHALMGENGAGKSTLMKVLSGVHPTGSYTGEVLVDGEPCTFSGVADSERAGIAIIHQELALIPQLSISENIFLGHERARYGVVDWGATHARARELLDRVGLDANPSTPVSALSVGARQLVEIAKALAKRVRLLILDEPTSALNEAESTRLLELLLDLRDQGVTCILISHKLGEVVRVCDEITILRDGRAIETLSVERDADGTPSIDEDRIIRGMVGRELDQRHPPRTGEIGGVRFEVRDWTVDHPDGSGRRAVDGADLTLRAGEVVGMAGLMGAGRTEFAMSLFGRSYGRYVRGTLLKDGAEAATGSVAEAIRSGIAYVPEDRKSLGLVLDDDIRHNTTMAALDRVSSRGVLNPGLEAVEASRMSERMRVRSQGTTQLVRTLSGGNQQKVVLGKWMFTRPELLILDEPTRGIDVGAKYEIYLIVRRLAAEGACVLLISSELPEILGMCDRIYTMCEGRITGEVPGEGADQETLMRLMTRTGGHP
ncbi:MULTISPECIES: sugar ABC transporter ATP-binding protein [Nocardiopsis]|uniref:ABC transporter ATP-binding protein n=1 Tax=Nocardiopsis sinuspersici TaxID=501010 RepID=A0A1V3BWS8_9ACTN|nr:MULTISPECIES: sugar ABC transporter ATP-binding protein [Nocardiopsis]NYH54222.1 putative multiple sugar transport system ATP-binding protein [Nocardiopsis sinuspersici]OOC53047.1 ABC transporter ATP-binding protein [Nocardiopsis sinuspersici]